MAGYELRSVAQEALFRVQMLSPDETLVQRAWEVLLQIDRVHKAADPEDFDRCRDITRELIKDFVTTAKGTLGLT